MRSVVVLVGAALLGCQSRAASPDAGITCDAGWCVQTFAKHPFSGVSGSSDADIWAISGGVIMHFDGTTWSVVPGPQGFVFMGVWDDGSSDAWAVGVLTPSDNTVLHWDGATWSPSLSGAASQLAAVWGTSASDVWVGGRAGELLHWDGAAWQSVASGVTDDITSIWGSSASDVWASPAFKANILHFDGSAWSSMATPDEPSTLWGAASNDVWTCTHLGGVMHWDGSSWKENAPAFPSATLVQGVSGGGPGDVWVAASQGLVAHWDGIGWSTLPLGDATDNFESVWATPTGAWVVGAKNGGDGVILHFTR